MCLVNAHSPSMLLVHCSCQLFPCLSLHSSEEAAYNVLGCAHCPSVSSVYCSLAGLASAGRLPVIEQPPTAPSSQPAQCKEFL